MLNIEIIASGSEIRPCIEINKPLVELILVFVCLFDLILYVPSTIFQLNRDRSSWVEPVLS